MKRLKLTKVIASTLIVTSILALNPIGASAEWKSDSTGWWYTEGSSYATDFKKIDGNTYYFGQDGYMKTGWIQFDNYWRYFYSNGEMAHDTVINGYVIDTAGIWAKDTTPDEVEYFKNLAFREIYDIDSNKKIVFDGCYVKEDYTYGKVFEIMNIEDDIIFMYEIVPKNGQIQSEPTKIIIGKDSKNVYEITGGLGLSQWKNKQKVKTFKYI